MITPGPVAALTPGPDHPDHPDPLLDPLRDWADRDGSVPSRQRVMDAYRCGIKRADRLRDTVRQETRT